jgi:hypothetical protein
MTLKEIIDKSSMLSVKEVRRVTDDYGELVFDNRKLDEWNRVFTDILGPPTKPAGAQPSADDLDLTREYGGIWVNQTLFKREFDDFVLIAMYWPWQDNIHTTLKLAHVRKTSA